MVEKAIIDLLYKLADDLLILGHRNSEWTGLGPLLEEDIAFSSMAQDKIGQSLEFYKILHQAGESDPDTLAFLRNADLFHNCQFVELPNAEYDFSLIRHFLFDMAEIIRFEMLSNSSIEIIAQAAKKFKGEIKYHVMHAESWIQQLGSATEDSINRLQKSLDYALPYALGIFEESKYEEVLINEKVFGGEKALKEQWEPRIREILETTSLVLPNFENLTPVYGGRYGDHTEHLQLLVDEMSEVFKVDPKADW